MKIEVEHIIQTECKRIVRSDAYDVGKAGYIKLKCNECWVYAKDADGNDVELHLQGPVRITY